LCVEAGGVQGRARRQLRQLLAGVDLDLPVPLLVLPAVPLRHLRERQRVAAGAALEQRGHVPAQHLHAGVDLAVQGGLVAHHPVEPLQGLVLGDVRVLEELGLPALEAPEPPGGGGDLLGVVLLQEVAGLDLAGEGVEEGLVALGVLAEVGQDDVAGEQAVGGGALRVCQCSCGRRCACRRASSARWRWWSVGGLRVRR
jgi:hypothetical protein